MMYQTLAGIIGFPLDSFKKAKIQHTDSLGDVVKTDVSYGRNNGVTVTNNPTGSDPIDLTPDRLVVVPDALNTLYGYKCSVGEHYLRDIQAISVDLPNERICVRKSHD